MDKFEKNIKNDKMSKIRETDEFLKNNKKWEGLQTLAKNQNQLKRTKH